MLDLDTAVVEVTSKETGYPVEAAQGLGEMRGWRAADSQRHPLRHIFLGGVSKWRTLDHLPLGRLTPIKHPGRRATVIQQGPPQVITNLQD